jgi:genome maintenance exonuclease 1
MMTNSRIFEHIGIDLGYEDLVCETKPEGRKYITPDGEAYPSITTVLSILSAASIAAWRKRVGDKEADKVSRQAAGRGTDVHAIIEKYLDNDPSYKKGYMPHIINSFADLKPIFDSRIGKIYAQEVPLYSDHLGVAGRVDCVAEFDGQISIIDFKTSRRNKTKDKIHNYFMQESAYAIMWEERTKIPITQLVTIMTVDHNEPQVFIEHRDNWTGQLLNTIEKYKKLNGS